MQIKATQKFVRMSPRKLRLVVPLVKNLSPTDAVEVLPHTGKRAAELLGKVIKSAIASAKERKISDRDLIFKEIQITDGPRLKRYRAGAKGRAKPYQRKMSHIRVILETKEPELIEKAKKKIAVDKGTTGSKSTMSTAKKGFKSRITDRLRKGGITKTRKTHEDTEKS